MGGQAIRKDSKQAAWDAAQALAEIKAQDVLVLDVEPTSSFADYFVIATGESSVHMRALADRVRKTLRERESRIKHAEGGESRNWILLDYSDIVVHIFSKPARQYYGLETLWGDAAVVHFHDEAQSDPTLSMPSQTVTQNS